MQSTNKPSGSAPRDEAWLEALFTSCHGAIHAYAMRRAPEDADDIVSEVFSVAWRKREAVPEPPLPWLYAVASREVLHVRRSYQRRHDLGTRVAAFGDRAAPNETDAATDRIAAHDPVSRAMRHLTESDAEILRLWAWEQLEPVEIATVLGITGVTARVRLHRAQRRLRAVLDDAPAPRQADHPITRLAMESSHE